MSLKEGSRRFGKILTDNVAGQKSNVFLLKPYKRISEENQDLEVDSHKKLRQIPGQENKDEVTGKKEVKTKPQEPHVRKLDLDVIQEEAKKAVPRVTRSSMIKINARFSTDAPVDPKIVKMRESVDFTDPKTYYQPPNGLPDEVEDFDKTQLTEVSSEAQYAHDIFLYYKEKELKYLVPKYMHQQIHITKSMRAVLVDWMVEVQESFELNHETLYLAVKLVDHYLSKKVVSKDKFQLLGATCLLMAAKYDERIPSLHRRLFVHLR